MWLSLQVVSCLVLQFLVRLTADIGKESYEGADMTRADFVYSFGLRFIFVPDEIPDPEELSEGILVLVKDAKSDFFGEGKIVQIGDSLYMEPKDGALSVLM